MSPREAQQLSERVEVLLGEIEESAPEPVRARVEDLVRALVALYGAGLERVVETAEPEGVRRLVGDELVASLLVLHDLHPDDVTTRVQAALDRVRPYLGSHAGGVDLLGVDEDGVVHLRLEGSCDGCPSSAVTVASAIEDAVLRAGPDVVALEVEGLVDGRVEEQPAAQASGAGLLQIPRFRPHDGSAGPTATPQPSGPDTSTTDPSTTDRDWVAVDASVMPGACASVTTPGGPILLANLGGDTLAYAECCPDCGTGLAGGDLAGEALACPGCGHRWDLRHAGRGLDSDAVLAPVPLLPDGDGWTASVPAARLTGAGT